MRDLLLPNLATLRLAPCQHHDSKHEASLLSSWCGTGSNFVSDFIETLQRSGVEEKLMQRTSPRMRYNIGKVLGSLFVESLIFIQGFGFSITDENEFAFQYFNDSDVLMKIVFSEEFLKNCILYFSNWLLKDHLKNEDSKMIAFAWRALHDNAFELFYEFPELETVDTQVLCFCCTDLYPLTRSDVPDTPPPEYVVEYLCNPWYFRHFLNAFNTLLPIWKTKTVNDMSFSQFATLSWKALGLQIDPHNNTDLQGAFSLVKSYTPTKEDLTSIQELFAYDTCVLKLVDSFETYQTIFFDFLDHPDHPPVATPVDTVPEPNQVWVAFFKRTLEEKANLVETLEKLWRTFVDSRMLTDLVKLIQTFNGNHYFRDGNGRFSMLLIQLHLMTTKNRLTFFHDHNPNGICQSKYVRMIETMPRIPVIAPATSSNKYKEFSMDALVDADAVKRAFEAAYETTRCDARLFQKRMPYLGNDDYSKRQKT